ncbi:MAG: hypothetical protein GX589_07940 [Deltaproteobacteria bacterium]|nr:hypothetical protein [Deltaproteobacteria bacterium]
MCWEKNTHIPQTKRSKGQIYLKADTPQVNDYNMLLWREGLGAYAFAALLFNCMIWAKARSRKDSEKLLLEKNE